MLRQNGNAFLLELRLVRTTMAKCHLSCAFIIFRINTHIHNTCIYIYNIHINISIYIYREITVMKKTMRVYIQRDKEHVMAPFIDR